MRRALSMLVRTFLAIGGGIVGYWIALLVTLETELESATDVTLRAVGFGVGFVGIAYLTRNVLAGRR